MSEDDAELDELLTILDRQQTILSQQNTVAPKQNSNQQSDVSPGGKNPRAELPFPHLSLHASNVIMYFADLMRVIDGRYVRKYLLDFSEQVRQLPVYKWIYARRGTYDVVHEEWYLLSTV